jgi:hypothetical protein
MKKIALVLWSIVFIFNIKLFAQSQHIEKHINSIMLREFKVIIHPTKIPDTLNERVDDNNVIRIYLQDSRGASTFWVFDLKKKIRIKGEYENASHLRKRNEKIFDKDANMIIHVEKYFQPIPVGVWLFYNEKGVIIKRRKYSY